MDFVLPENASIDRYISYKGVDYKIVEILNSETVLVVKKEDFDNGIFPIQTFILPGQ